MPYLQNIGGALQRFRKMNRISLFVGAGVLTLALSAGTAHAQVLAAEDMAQPEAEAGGGPGDIVVTARRRSETLQSVPVAVTAFNQEMLTQKSIVSAFQLNKAVPGLTVQASSSSTTLPAFSIRGRGQTYGTASGSVEVYFAEVPLSGPFQAPGLPVQFFDLDSFQVLKGPQGTLFGRNTTGGAILVVPAAPTDQFEGYGRAQAGNYGNIQLEGAVNVPLATGIDLRLAGFMWHRNGYMHSLAGGIDGFTGEVLPHQTYQNQNTKELRATLRVAPSDGFENSTIFTYHYDKVRASTSPGLNSDFFDGIPLGTFIGIEPVSGHNIYLAPGAYTRYGTLSTKLARPANKAFAVINTTTFDLTDSLSLKNIMSYIKAEGYSTSGMDSDGTSKGGLDFTVPTRPNKNRQFTNEIQLRGEAVDKRLQWTVGGLVDLTRQPASFNINDQNVSYGVFVSTFERNRYTSYSLFGSGSFAISDTLNLAAGYRHTWDNVKIASQTFASTDQAEGIRMDIDPGNPIFLLQSKARKFQGDSYNIGLDYKPSSDLMIYASYRHGYKRGGFNVTDQSSLGEFDGEQVDNFNLGVKHSFDVGGLRGRLSVEGFYDIYKGLQLTYGGINPDTGLIGSITLNVPKTIFKGIEGELHLEPADFLSLSGSASYIDAGHTRWPDVTLPSAGTQDLTVNPVANVSKWKASVSARLHKDFSDDSEIAFVPAYNYQSRFTPNTSARTLTVSTQQSLGYNYDSIAGGSAYIPGYGTLDARLEWNRVGGSNISLAASVTNVTNKFYLLSTVSAMYYDVGAFVVGEPRMATFEVKVTF